MAKKITAKKFTANVIISITAQIISLAVGFVLNLIVPKFIDGYQYAYWQTYTLYVSYVGILHFGLLDGLVLRYSQYDYEELDKERLRSQFKLLLAFTAVLTVLTTAVSLLACKDVTQIVVILVSFGIVTKNLVTYSSYSFQITNRIHKYAILIIAQRLFYGVIVCVLLLCKVNDFYWYCIADLAGDAISFTLATFFNRGMYFGKSLRLKEAFKETKINVAAGIILMISNWSAMMIINGAKMIVQWRWDELVFGKVAFAFSLANLFLTFITAASVVLFPSLKRLDKDKLPSLYKNIRDVLSPLLLLCLIFYFPGCWILGKWLPNYAPSLTYLGILLPIILFTSKVNLLTNNYLKAYRKEKAMLAVNVISVALGAVLFIVCAYALNNLIAMLACIVGVVAFNAVLSEIMVLRTIKVKIIKDFIIEIIMVVGFILAVQLLEFWWGCLAYGILYLCYCAVNYKAIIEFIKKLLKLPAKDGTGEISAPQTNEQTQKEEQQ